LSAGSDSRRIWTGLNYLAQGALNLMFASAIGALRSGFSLSRLTSSRLGCSKQESSYRGSSTSVGSRALSITHKFSTDADTQLNINEAS
jgi:hypothetical protein